MPRSRRPKKTRSFGQLLVLLLLVNIVPIGVGAYLFVQHRRGEITLNELPAGFGGNLLGAGACLALLAGVATFSLPVAHDLVKSFARKQRQAAAILRGAEQGSRVLSLLVWPFHLLFRTLAALLRSILILVSLLLIALLLLFLARLRWPDLGQDWIDRAFEFARSHLPARQSG